MNKKARTVSEEAARILFENPNLKYYEAIIKAKEILKEKEPEVKE